LQDLRLLKRVYITVINDLATDQRVKRVANMLGSQGMHVTCIGRKLKDSPALENSACKTKRFKMLFKRGPLFYACFNIRLFLTLLCARKPALFISNDLDTLPATFLSARIRKIPLIYDSHELFTQVPELIHRKRTQGVWKRIEALFVPRLNHAITVSYPIAEIYRRLYKTRFKVVRNVPERRKAEPHPGIREEYKGRSIILYQGALNVGRGLELMIQAMEYMEDSVFVVAGSGDIEADLKQLCKEKGLSERIIFTGRLLPDELARLTMSADIGISLEEDLGLNYRYALPNKLFDYIQCRIPVLCSALPEMARVVETYGVGIATREKNPKKLAGIMKYMLEERSSGAWMEALDRAALELCWENESQVYLDLLSECGVLQQ
jgi:glycosyltransferase involved in cell wall biosynthesis